MEKHSVSISPKTLWMILAMAVGVFIAWELRSFLMVVLVSVIIASFIEAGARAFKRAKVPRIVAVIILYVIGFAVIFGALYLVVPLFASELSEFIALFPKNSAVVGLLTPLAHSGLSGDTLRTIIANRNLIADPATFIASIEGVFGGIVNALLVVIISFYLSVQEHGIEQFLRVVTPVKYEDYVVDVWTRTEKKIGYWFGSQALVALLIGLITYVGLFLLGVPYALILATISFVFEFVPFGTLLSLTPAVILGFLGGGFGLAIEIFIFYGVMHYIEAYFLQPYVLHRTIGMPMLVIILAIIACVELFGLIGILVAIPIAVLILELIYDQGLGRFKKTHPSLPQG